MQIFRSVTSANPSVHNRLYSTSQKRAENVSKTYQQEQFNLMICYENALKTSLQHFMKMYWRHIEDALKTFSQDVLRRSWKRLEDVLAGRLRNVLKVIENVWKMAWSCMTKANMLVPIRHLEDVLKTSFEDVWPRRIYSSWSRRLEDVLKTSSAEEYERRPQDECLLRRELCLSIFNFLEVSWVESQK